ncbi:MAG: aldo/keto reductase, partial [Hafnia sp.]
LAWLLSKPVVTAPIIGASRASQLEDAIAALDIELKSEEIAELEMAYQPHEQTGFE